MNGFAKSIEAVVQHQPAGGVPIKNRVVIWLSSDHPEDVELLRRCLAAKEAHMGMTGIDKDVALIEFEL